MSGDFPHVFRPLQVGSLALDHRLVVPPHGGGAGHLIGPDASFEQHCAQWLAKLDGGFQWLGGAATFVANPIPPGFEVTGVGAHGPGFFRQPDFSARMAEFARRVHAKGGYLTTQMVLQGGMPLGASDAVTGYNDHRSPHVLHVDEVRWLVREYGESAALAIDAGADAIEIHANHDDIVQWFLSPVSNHRRDEYGGSFEARMRFLREIVESIRARQPRHTTLGLRLCLDEFLEGGMTIEDTCRLVAAFSADGTVDYFSMDIGNNWGSPSYIPHGSTDEAQWAPLCGRVKEVTELPVIYACRVTSPATAERIIAAGQADAVGLVRGSMADPEFVVKARSGHVDRIRPCIGLNECIHAHLVDGHSYACGVNPQWARESAGPLPAAGEERSILVIGGGPAGSEFAGLAAEQGHRVTLWEARDRLGGALAIAARARVNRRYADWIRWQEGRLARAGVTVEFGHTATATDVLAFGADVVAVATGATPRVPRIPGVDLPFVVQGAAAVQGTATLGRRVLVIAEDDGPASLSAPDHLAADGHQVTLAFQTPGPAPLVGKYSVGAMLERLDRGGVTLVPMARVVRIAEDDVVAAHSYSGRRWSLGRFDSVVLVCGGVGNDSLFHELRAQGADVHLLGDAFAPRRMVWATRQAWELARTLA